ncbi:sigma-54 dependent transcriptional regulator [Luteimonas sp. MC1750]|uniref:sigma-54-dependent transcriptional regulator n=1 Tax=Luteimonas sp. MC1750 TaxID=2799326 RepID=UPI0018F0FFDC|nr:sigma-54 dependent transcriptional regulator [Luteimonas sp. MC1750]MBJ6985308.1 sigma-54-dependent Fis family transcriptional regulator [Luteimonas sp. MC1750]QQO05427.1 sigma-54-dependent Fis family transcriptional regulator [Luteimonas sp. MC1750]
MTEARSALIVDDEHDIRELLVLTLGRMGLRTDTAASLGTARQMLAQNRYDLCLTDMRLPDGSGLELISDITTRFPETPVAMITAYGNVEAAVEALKAGAFDFVSKPVDINVLRGLVRQALELHTRRQAQPEEAGRLLGGSPAMVALRETIAKVSRSQAPVHISGESGTGKELVARTIHAQGSRANGPFIPVNCGAIPTELMESEFFGHKKGSFTGAHADKPGLFQSADGGTLFLDEVAELPLAMQVKLLRAIQEKKVRPVGAQNEVDVDVRILSATHKDLGALVNAGSFRHDLYYRINVIELHVPALRDRDGDLPILSDAIFARLAQAMHRAAPRLGPDALAALNEYAFPGNVRELENVLERAMAMADSDSITAADLRLPGGSGINSPARAVPQPGGLAAHGGAANPANLNPRETASSALPSYIEEIERAAIQQALQESRYNKTKAAAALGITFRALRYKLKKLGID